ncbi:ACT domain-containing protein [Bacillus sp. HMF5848]|uniref:ACT domain-containing protein n=1 Tax=Bacillus sp. HMF5848 TaxID=2495421 RepID=UPI000F783477|nr:ACT domain-containing protein [Bacillus sp. HMF5848]RSK28003.1 ACT domain-containing protein [Bacillus sp. HMF5848]
MVNKKERFFLVREDVLPEAIKKTIEAKELIEKGKAKGIAEATAMADVSRSAFYKYRDAVFPFHRVVKENIISLFIYLEDRSGTLSEVLHVVAKAGFNILTIHQTIPLQGRANVTLSLDTSAMTVEINELLAHIRRLEFVIKVDVLGTGV